MSFGLPALHPKASSQEEFKIKDDSYGVCSPMTSGLSAVHQDIGYAHPLAVSVKNLDKSKKQMDMIMLRNTQGLHAPLRLAMELKATKSIGRLPFMQSSHLMRDTLLGRDEEIGFEDVLNIPEFTEQMGQPHAVIEKSLGIL